MITARLSITGVLLYRDYYQTELNERRRIRFIYHGQVLTDLGRSLESCDIRNNSALHVHIGPPSSTQPHQPSHATDGDDRPLLMDLSPLFLPLIGLMLGIVWTTFLIYPYVFSLLTKVMLFILSIGYVFLVYSVHYY